MTTEIERDEESSDICTVLLFVGITIVSLIWGFFYYFTLFGWIEIVIVVVGVLLICGWIIISESKDSPKGITSTHITCPVCKKGVIYTYESKDAFGRVACSHCGMRFSPSKSQVSSSSSTQPPLNLPQENPRPFMEDHRHLEVAEKMTNTRLSYSIARGAVRDAVDSLGMDRIGELIKSGCTYLGANWVAVALACFYEAELINFNDERLVKIRAQCNRSGWSFDDIAEEYFQST